MPKKPYMEKQILGVLQQRQTGKKVAEICRKSRIAQRTYYAWKNQYAAPGVRQIRELCQLREENRLLKRLVVILSVDSQMLQDIMFNKMYNITRGRKLGSGLSKRTRSSRVKSRG